MSNHVEEPRRLSVVAGVSLLMLRGILLWVVVPVAAIVWIISFPIWRRRGFGLGVFLAWADLNLIAFLERTILRPMTVGARIEYPSLSEARASGHRIRFLDPA